jgi:hypothetical protein
MPSSNCYLWMLRQLAALGLEVGEDEVLGSEGAEVVVEGRQMPTAAGQWPE